MEVHWEVDVPVGVGAFAIGGTMQLLRDELVQTRCAPSCPRDRVNGLDAVTLGRYSELGHHAGNAFVSTSIALPLAIGALQVAAGEQDWLSFAQDTALVAQSLAVTVMLHQIVAFTTQRPRPYAYNDSIDPALLDNANTYLSFYSGHTANAFAEATSYGYLYTLRHGGGPRTAAVWTLGMGLAAMQGYLRVTSGYHYLTDVLVGAAAGTAAGLLIPWLHTTGESGSKAASFLPKGITPTAVPVAGGSAVGVAGYF